MKEIINQLFELSKERKVHPSGSFDAQKRWYPDPVLYKEVGSIRMPSRAYPFSFMVHCRTKKFIARLLEKYKPANLEQAIDLYTRSTIPTLQIPSELEQHRQN